MSLQFYLSPRPGWVHFRTDGPWSLASEQDLVDAQIALESPQFENVRIDGQPVDEADVAMLQSALLKAAS